MDIAEARQCARLDRAKSAPLRYDELELLRGLAAIAVVIYHFLRAFIPPHQAPREAHMIGVAVEPPFVLGLVNGPFMVTIFFVLSSFALTIKLVGTPQPIAVSVGMLKRFPRLYLLTLFGTMLPAALFVAGLMYNDEAARLTGSEWLRLSGGVKVWGDWPQPTLDTAMFDSLRLFGRGLSQFNSALWTMRYELFGSLLALATALLIGGRQRPIFDLAGTAVLSALALMIHPLCSICVGIVLVTKYLRGSTLSFSPRAAMLLIAAGVTIGSTYQLTPEELPGLVTFGHHAETLDWFYHGLGALLVFLGVHRWRRVRTPDWPFARLLGRISFAVYVVHIPVIGSLASAIIFYMGYGWLSVLLAGLATVATIALLAILLSSVDQWWVRKLNATARMLTPARFSKSPVQERSDAP